MAEGYEGYPVTPGQPGDGVIYEGDPDLAENGLSDSDLCPHGFIRDHAHHPAAGLEWCPVCDPRPEGDA